MNPITELKKLHRSYRANSKKLGRLVWVEKNCGKDGREAYNRIVLNQARFDELIEEERRLEERGSALTKEIIIIGRE